jgi:predicted nucleic acid-binding protein
MGQVIAIDTQILTYVVEGHRTFGRPALRIIQSIEAREYAGVFASIGVIELLTGPKKAKRYDLVFLYRQLIQRYPNLSIINLNERIIELASDVRAQYNIRTPDAIHIATAIDAGAGIFYTNDRNLKRVKEIKVQTL